jgi:CubicO group peptidase (beta-lactamase class C family)
MLRPLLLLVLSAVTALAQLPLASRVDDYLAPYVKTNNFTGAVLIAKGDRVLVDKAYGFANYSLRVPNTPETRFHIASISKPFTAAAILKLQQRGLLAFDDSVQKYVPEFSHKEVTVRQLLTHTSGVPNINDLPEYNQLSRFPQTPRSLVNVIKDRPLDFPAGSKYAYSNTNYNLLALIIETLSHQSYAEFMQQSVFAPLALSNTGADHDAARIIANAASGYVPAGATEIGNAPYLDWSAKTGNGSLYSTTHDLFRFVRAYSRGQVVPQKDVDEIWKEHRGNQFGWFARQTHGQLAIATNGRSPGFTASAEYYPKSDVTVIVLSNSYSPVSQSPIADDLAALALGENVQPPKLTPAKLSKEEIARATGRFKFPGDFYQPNAEVTLRFSDGGSEMQWPNDSSSGLLPLGNGELIDRLYWSTLKLDADGKGFTYSGFGRSFHATKMPD